MGKIKSFIKANRTEFILLTLILLIGAFCRLYRINQYMTFLGDEGRDVIIVRRIFTELHPPLIGPGTSIGNMYLGPAYYYMMAIPLLVANFNPVGPAIFIAILGIITILFVWYVAREWFPAKINYGALTAAFLYSVSPVVIIYSRSSWNPNIMPFFSLATIYFMWRVWMKKEFKFLTLVGIFFAFCLQSHYLALLLAPPLGIMWILTFFKSTKTKRKLIIFSLISLFLFLLIMSPLAIFDFRHSFINSKAIISFFKDRQTTVSILPWKAIPNMWPILINIASDIVGAKNATLGVIVSFVIAFAFLFVYLIKREKYDARKISVIITLTLWLGFALIGMALYKQHIYDHYFGFVFTAPFLILGGIIQYLINKKKIVFISLVGIFVFVIAFIDLQSSPLLSAPNMQLQRAQFVAKKVEEISGGQRFNFALIADSNYDSGYRYFLDLYKEKVVDIDVQNTKDTVTSQLVVVCERVKAKCDPTHNAKTEIAAWGWSKVETEYDNVFGVTIYKLEHVPMK